MVREVLFGPANEKVSSTFRRKGYLWLRRSRNYRCRNMLKTQEDERKERTLMQDGALIALHSHILPAIDDGSPDVETSLEMLHRESAQGVDTVCATSHYNFKDHSIPTFCTRREEAFARLTAAAEEEMPQVRLAAEVAYFPHMEEEDLSPLCIEGTHTLMLEMPFIFHPCASRAPIPSCWKCPFPTGPTCRSKPWRHWSWTAPIRWCWCIPSDFASVSPTGIGWKNWPNCPLVCKSTLAV